MNGPVFSDDFWASVERRAEEARAEARAELGELEERLTAEDQAGGPLFSDDFWASVERRAEEARAEAKGEIGELERRLAGEDAGAEASQQRGGAPMAGATGQSE